MADDLARRALPHWAEAHALARLLLRDRARAYDVCQEAFARLAARETDDARRDVRPLLFRIVRNLAIDEQRRVGAISLESRIESAGPIPDLRAPDPAEEASRREQIRRMQRGLATLDPLWQTVLYLRDGVGLSYREIASVIERTEDVVRVTLHRARRRLRTALGANEERKCS